MLRFDQIRPFRSSFLCRNIFFRRHEPVQVLPTRSRHRATLPDSRHHVEASCPIGSMRTYPHMRHVRWAEKAKPAVSVVMPLARLILPLSASITRSFNGTGRSERRQHGGSSHVPRSVCPDRAMTAGAVLALAFFFLALREATSLPVCCINSTSGLAFDGFSCSCMTDNTRLTGQTLARGKSRLYHWVLGSNNSALVSESPRGNLTFEMTPCNGSASFVIKSASPGSWPYLPSFQSSDGFETASITLPAAFTEQSIIVTASDDTAFEMSSYNTLYDRPTPGDAGRLNAAMITTGSAQVFINTTDQLGQNDVMYNLYWSSLSQEDGSTAENPATASCVMSSGNISLRQNPECLFWSACGLERAAEGSSGWISLNATRQHTFEVPVDEDVTYLFNVAMRDARNLTAVYAGTNVSFTIPTYQDCVVDTTCSSQVNSDATIITVGAVASAVLVALIITTKLLRMSIARTMSEAVLAKGQEFTPLGAALKRDLTGKSPSGIKQRIHVEDNLNWNGQQPPDDPRGTTVSLSKERSSLSSSFHQSAPKIASLSPSSLSHKDSRDNRQATDQRSATSQKRSSEANPQKKLLTSKRTTGNDFYDNESEDSAEGDIGWNTSSPARTRNGASRLSTSITSNSSNRSPGGKSVTIGRREAGSRRLKGRTMGSYEEGGASGADNDNDYDNRGNLFRNRHRGEDEFDARSSALESGFTDSSYIGNDRGNGSNRYAMNSHGRNIDGGYRVHDNSNNRDDDEEDVGSGGEQVGSARSPVNASRRSISSRSPSSWVRQNERSSRVSDRRNTGAMVGAKHAAPK